MENLSAADIAAVTRPSYGMGGGYGMGGFGGDWLAILVLFALFGGWGGGFGGGFGGGGAGIGMQNGFDTQTLLRGQEGIKNGLCDGFYAMNTSNLQAQNQLQRDLCSGFAAINAGIAENRYSAKDCCCETQRLIEGVKYANQQNTCDIVNAIHAEGNATRDLITQNKIEAMQTKITELTALAQSKDLAISQANQNAYLINKLQPCPIPAYITCNPNQAVNTCGCNGYSQFA
ncbi:MAG: hypothetical protein NC191_08925 [Muribaculaceae bacterium]|nr:hypothetical protein [Muribaculaceae bacterium]